jgi:hypothetical protein
VLRAVRTREARAGQIWLVENAERVHTESMTHGIFMQYTGFESKNRGREYAFQVRFAAEDVRDFTVTITVEAFDSRRVRFQDAPDVCSLRLKRELTANVDCPSNTNFLITDTDLDDYRNSHSSKPEKHKWAASRNAQ